MINTNLEKPEVYLQQLYELLIENNKDKDKVLIFLVKLYFFLYLGSDKLIVPFEDFILKIKETQSPEELIKILTNYFNLLIIPTDEQSSQLMFGIPIIGEPYSHQKEFPKLSVDFLQYLKSSSVLDYSWNKLNALQFCNLFESLINIEDKHNNGMYFTSKENILKVIKPLFLDKLNKEFEHILKLNKGIPQRIKKFQKKISNLTFLDPACGVGNFLVVTYEALKNLEAKILDYLQELQIDIFKSYVSIDQFYGIEINESAALISKVALLIAQLQYNKKINYKIIFPYKNTNIIESNALQINWNNLIKNYDLNYILGNPPFLGARLMSSEQKNDLMNVFGKKWKHLGNLDYVSGWYKKSLDYMKGTNIEAAFVSTSSITEGMSAANLFKPLIKEGMIIDFAYQSFKWNQDTSFSAQVFVVIIGFREHKEIKDHYIYLNNNTIIKAKHINGYLLDGPEIYAESREKPICSVPDMGIGNKPIDNGNYLFKFEEYQDFIQKEPESKKFFKPFYGASELTHNNPRYCLWLGDSSEEEYKHLTLVNKRIENVKNFRLQSKSKGTRKLAQSPTHFHVENIPDSNYLAIPRVSSSNRDYLPIAYLSPENLAGDSLLIVPDMTLYHFGVLNSNLHMIWLNFVCGRLGNALRYSKKIVYNNFPWPEPNEMEIKRIEKTAQEILNTRYKYKDIDFNNLYKPNKMPEDLKEVHKKNDKAVLKAYHFKKSVNDKYELLNLLFNRYRKIISK